MNKLITMVVIGLTLFGWLGSVAAADPTPKPTIQNVTDSGTLTDPGGGLFTRQNSAKIDFPNLITRFTGPDVVGDAFSFVLDILTLFGGVIAFGYMVYGGVKFITSAGVPAQAEEGKKIVVGAVVGVVIIALAYVLTNYVRDLITGTL